MTILAPSPILDYPVYRQCHHKWILLVEDAYGKEWPYELEQTIIAVCTQSECGMRLSKEEVEQILDNQQ